MFHVLSKENKNASENGVDYIFFKKLNNEKAKFCLGSMGFLIFKFL